MRGSIQQVLFGLKPPSTGAITLDAVSGVTLFANSNIERTTSLVLGSGANRAVVGFVSLHTSALTTVRFNGVAMTLAKQKFSGGTPDMRTYIYYMLDADLPAAGTYNFAVDPEVAGRGGIYCLSLFGVKQDVPDATGEGASTTSVSSWANSITTVTPGAWIFDCNCANDRTFTPTSPQTERFDFVDSTISGHAGSSKEQASAGATTMGQTPSSATAYAQAIAAFAPA